MAIDFTTGEYVVISRAYVEKILGTVDCGCTQQTLSSLGYIGANPSEVLATGSVFQNATNFSFIRIRPLNTNNPAYKNNQGVTIYFCSDAHLNNSLELSTAFIDDKCFIKAQNVSGSAMTKGQLVYQSGFDNTLQLPNIDLASAAASSTSAVIGILSADVAAGECGSVLVEGSFGGLNTSAFTEVGQTVFLSDTPGAFATSGGTVERVVAKATTLDATEGVILLDTVTAGTGGGGGGGGFFTDGAGTNAGVGKGATAPTATGANSLAQGDSVNVSGINSFALGNLVSVGGENNFALGYQTYIDGGLNNFAQGYYNYIGSSTREVFAQGYQNYGNDTTERTLIQGGFNYANSDTYNCIIQGYGNTVEGRQIFIQGLYNDWDGSGVENAFIQGQDIDFDGSLNAYQVFAQGRNHGIGGECSNTFIQGYNLVSGVRGANNFFQGSYHTLDDNFLSRVFIQGTFGRATLDDQKVWGSNRTGVVGVDEGKAQSSKIVKYFTTVNATTFSFSIPLDTDKSYLITAKGIARNTTTNGESASFVLSQTCAYNDSGTAVLVGTPAFTGVNSGGGAAAWSMGIAASGSDINIQYTGDASDTVRWCFDIGMVEVAG